MTAATGHLNPFQLKPVTSFLDHTTTISLFFFLLLPVPGFTSFELPRREVSVFARSSQRVLTNIRCQVNQPSVTEADGGFSFRLPSGEQKEAGAGLKNQ